MPNWVMNSWDGYTEDLHKKYKSDKRELDFNKVIPMPEEIQNTISGSLPEMAKRIAGYRVYYKEMSEGKPDQHINAALRWDPKDKNPLKKDVENLENRTQIEVGKACIKNPDKSLNQLIKGDNKPYLKNMYEHYVSVFGNRTLDECDKEMVQVYENFIQHEEDQYTKEKSPEEQKRRKDMGIGPTPEYPNMEEYGKALFALKEKYGFDNWYNWSCHNWGCKWNAGDSNYDPESKLLTFDTPWSIPYPILNKIAQDNPEAKIDGYSEEETGWFEEYKTDNGKVFLTKTGEYIWGDENGETQEKSVTLDPPEEYKSDPLPDLLRSACADLAL